MFKGGDFSKFIVIKSEDANRYLTEFEKGTLAHLCTRLEQGRRNESKKTDNRYLVINTDEPYAEEIVQILKRNGHWG